MVLPNGQIEIAGPGAHKFTSLLTLTENPELITK